MRMREKKGFTLIEMVIAIALGAVILVAASSLLLSITQLWIKEENLDDFQGHVFGVKSFLEKHIRESSYTMNDKLPSVRWSPLPMINLGINESYLSFFIYTPSPLFDMDTVVPVVCYLRVDKKEGLSIMWYSLEIPGYLYERKLSPWVKSMKLYYYNQNKDDWDVEDKPRGDKEKPELPEFIELQFAKEGEDDQSVFVRLYPNQTAEGVVL